MISQKVDLSRRRNEWFRNGSRPLEPPQAISRPSATQLGSAWFRLGSDRLVSARLSLARLGSARLGLGLAWARLGLGLGSAWARLGEGLLFFPEVRKNTFNGPRPYIYIYMAVSGPISKPLR